MSKCLPTREQLEKRRLIIEADLVSKLEARDYHGVADAAMDLREIDAKESLLALLLSPAAPAIPCTARPISESLETFVHEFVMSSGERDDA